MELVEHCMHLKLCHTLWAPICSCSSCRFACDACDIQNTYRHKTPSKQAKNYNSSYLHRHWNDKFFQHPNNYTIMSSLNRQICKHFLTQQKKKMVITSLIIFFIIKDQHMYFWWAVSSKFCHHSSSWHTFNQYLNIIISISPVQSDKYWSKTMLVRI